jgi:hypothetical protein
MPRITFTSVMLSAAKHPVDLSHPEPLWALNEIFRLHLSPIFQSEI